MIQDHSNSKIHTGLIIDFKLITFSKCEQNALLLLTRIDNLTIHLTLTTRIFFNAIENFNGFQLERFQFLFEFILNQSRIFTKRDLQLIDTRYLAIKLIEDHSDKSVLSLRMTH